MTDKSDQVDDDEVMEIIKTAISEIPGLTLATPDELEEFVAEGKAARIRADEEAKAQGKIFLDDEKDQDTFKEWYATASDMTLPDFTEFARHLCYDYHHDYGSVVYATAAISLAATRAANRVFGLTHLQASIASWEWLEHWLGWQEEDMYRLQNVTDLLYPQMEHKFTTISQEQWDKLQRLAREKLETVPSRSSNVTAHWQSIVDGKVPFGMKIRD